MLQQTRVAAVVQHYARFMERFPTLESLAAATEDDVLALWSGLGYYRRARLLHKAAQFVVKRLGGSLPSKAAELRALPGVGEYTGAAIASIGFGEAVACVDGNVERVLLRLRGWDEGHGTAARIRAEAERLLDTERAGDFNQAMMELGAMQCLPRGPLCGECSVREMCATRGEHPTRERKKMRSKLSAYAFLRRALKKRGTEILLERRPQGASLMPGMWELPAIQPGGVPEEKRALTLRHSITDTNYYVSIYELEPKEEKELPTRDVSRNWFPLHDLHSLPLTGLTRKVLKRLRTWPGYDGEGPAVTLDEIHPPVLA